MNDQQLQTWIERISLQYFGMPFVHKASFNGRLRATGGRYFPGTHNIEISRLQYDTFGEEEVEKIIKHELCHYHLHLTNKGYKHRDDDFKRLLQKVGGSRYCRTLPIPKQTEPYRYRLECADCRAVYYRKRRLNPRKYACGRCRGKLSLHELHNGR